MIYRVGADLVVVLHLLFVLYVVAGALFCLKWPRAWLVHLPAAVWGVLVELNQWICPLTTAEQGLRKLANQSGYSGSFVDHYLVPILYPPGLTARTQIALGVVVVLVNLLLYGLVILKRRPAKNQ
ncbi:MAG: DUF2784 domain-containing protein [Xanthomonadales bacterium]|nr:DUF2784 domain-containing protein [Xanthomonadales bacterium]